MNNQVERILTTVYRLIYNIGGVCAILLSMYFIVAFLVTDSLVLGIKAIVFMLLSAQYQGDK